MKYALPLILSLVFATPAIPQTPTTQSVKFTWMPSVSPEATGYQLIWWLDQPPPAPKTTVNVGKTVTSILITAPIGRVCGIIQTLGVGGNNSEPRVVCSCR